MPESSDAVDQSFIKVDSSGEKHVTSGTITKKAKISEGSEGVKQFVDLKISHGGRERDAGSYVIREMYGENDLQEHLLRVSELRQAGIPVPPTVRYYIEDGKYFLLVTDFSENGKNLVWSINNNEEEIKKFQFKNEEIADLRKQLLDIADKATEAGYTISDDSYFVVKAPGEKPKVVIGDFGMNIISTERLGKILPVTSDTNIGSLDAQQKNDYYRGHNKKKAMEFLEKLSGKFEPFLLLGEEIDDRIVAQTNILGHIGMGREKGDVVIGALKSHIEVVTINGNGGKDPFYMNAWTKKDDVRVNGKFIFGPDVIYLHSGDEISLGGESFSVDIRDNVFSLLENPSILSLKTAVKEPADL